MLSNSLPMFSRRFTLARRENMGKLLDNITDDDKGKRRENMGKLLDNITDDDKGNAEAGKQAMERLVREELERWDSDASVSTPGAGSAGQLNTLRPSSGRSVVSNISQARSVSSTRAKHSQGS
jgi:polycystin 2